MKVEQSYELFIEERIGESLPEQSCRHIKKLTGDASSRKYYRVELEDQKTYVVCLDEPQPAEKNNFLKIQEIFRENQIRVPQIYDVRVDRGYILEEDLGDQTLLNYLARLDDEQAVEAAYDQALSLLLGVHRIDLERYPTAPFNMYSFDQVKLDQEVELTLLYFVEKYLGHGLSGEEKATLREGFSRINKKLAAAKQILCHRDYHSRNLMVKNDELVVIDFQDARRGPASYDLVSLLEDSYYGLSHDFKERCRQQYWQRFLKNRAHYARYEDFKAEYDLMACQRIFKAIGSFSYIYETRADTRYLKYIGNSFENLRQFLDQQVEMKAATRLLKKCYYDS